MCPAVDQIHDTVAEISAQVYEYTEAMAAAPSLKAVGLHEDFYYNVVGQFMPPSVRPSSGSGLTYSLLPPILISSPDDLLERKRGHDLQA